MFLSNLARRTLSCGMQQSFASAASVDYYKLLGIGKESTAEQIHQAYA